MSKHDNPKDFESFSGTITPHEIISEMAVRSFLLITQNEKTGQFQADTASVYHIRLLERDGSRWEAHLKILKADGFWHFCKIYQNEGSFYIHAITRHTNA